MKKTASGKGVRMVDVGDKADTERQAVAKGVVRMKPATAALIQQGGLAKGDVLAAAQVSGIMAAKRTHHLIPMCHPLLISDVNVGFHVDEAKGEIEITASVRCTGKTGVEMETLTAVAIGALTIYDMVKGVDPAIRIDGIRLVSKSGGKSGTVELE